MYIHKDNVVRIFVMLVAVVMTAPAVMKIAHSQAAEAVCCGGDAWRDNSRSAIRDNSGTTAPRAKERAPQPLWGQGVAGHGTFGTERAGFEPAVQVLARTTV